VPTNPVNSTAAGKLTHQKSTKSFCDFPNPAPISRWVRSNSVRSGYTICKKKRTLCVCVCVRACVRSIRLISSTVKFFKIKIYIDHLTPQSKSPPNKVHQNNAPIHPSPYTQSLQKPTPHAKKCFARARVRSTRLISSTVNFLSKLKFTLIISQITP
jgi:hypothetical protein